MLLLGLISTEGINSENVLHPDEGLALTELIIQRARSHKRIHLQETIFSGSEAAIF